MHNGQGQLSGTNKDTGQGISARQPEAPMKIKELETLQRICKPRLIFLRFFVSTFFISLKVKLSPRQFGSMVRLAQRLKDHGFNTSQGRVPWL